LEAGHGWIRHLVIGIKGGGVGKGRLVKIDIVGAVEGDPRRVGLKDHVVNLTCDQLGGRWEIELLPTGIRDRQGIGITAKRISVGNAADIVLKGKDKGRRACGGDE
jgi:hypothetical protein